MTNLREQINTNLRLAKEAKTVEAGIPFWKRATDLLVENWQAGNIIMKGESDGKA